MITSREVDIYVKRYGVQTTIPVVQYDSGRQIIFHVVDDTIPSGCTAYLFVRMPSGKLVYNNCTISNSTITVTPTNQTFAECGNTYGQIRISKNNEVITSFDVIFDVKKSYADGAIESISEVTSGQLINDMAVMSSRMDAFTSLTDGSTTGDAELTDIRIGSDGTTYANAGDAVRGQIDILKAGNAFNLLTDLRTNSYTGGGITFTYLGNGIYHVEGTCTANSGKVIAGDTNVIPPGMKPGDTLFVPKLCDDIATHIVEFVNGANTRNVFIYNDSTWTLADNITGVQIRIRVATGAIVNDDVKPVIFNCYSNQKLTEFVTEAEQEIANILNIGNKQNEVKGGISYVFNGLGGKCSVSGTSSSTSYITIAGGSTSIPSGLTPGKLVKIRYSSEKVALHIIQRNSSQEIIFNEMYYNDAIAPIDEDASYVEIRLRVASGVTVSEIVEPIITANMSNSDLSKVCYDLTVNARKPASALEQAARSFYIMTRVLGYTYGKRSALYYPDADPDYDPNVDTAIDQIHCGGMTAMLASGVNFYNSRYVASNTINKLFTAGYGFDFEAYSLKLAKAGNADEIAYIGSSNVSKTVDELKELMLFKTSYQLSSACLRWGMIVYIYQNGAINKNLLKPGDLLFFGKPNSGGQAIIDGKTIDNPVLFDGNLITHCNIIISIENGHIMVADAGSAPMRIIELDSIWNNSQTFKYICAGRVPLFDIYS